MEIRHLYLSPGHNYFGHYGREPDEHPTVEVEQIECVAGQGIRGDRFFDFKDNYRGQITFFSEEVYRELCAEFGLTSSSPGASRRNVITRGVDLNSLIGATFEVQGVEFRGTEECRPCVWMDRAFAPGAHEFLKGRGGLRAKIVSSGFVRAKNFVAAK